MSSSRLVKDFGAIFSTEVILLAASFISFPIFARLLSKADYGFMSLITMSLMLISNISSGGLNNSVLRFYGKHVQQGRSVFVNTMRTATFVFGVLGTVLYLSVAWVAGSLGVLNNDGYIVVAFASLLIIVRAMTKIELVFLRVSNHIMLMNTFNLLIRYGGIGASIWLVYRYKSLYSLYAGTIFAEIAVLLVVYVVFSIKLKVFAFLPKHSTPVFKEAFRYGLPLALTGLLSIVLSSTDRYLIGYFLNVEKVADYTVAVNFCNYPVEILRNVYLATFVPMIMNSWNNKSDRGNGRLLTNFVASYCWLAVPIVFGLTLIDTEGIKLLAGSRYSAVPYLVPLLASSFALNGMSFVYVSGLLFKEKSKCVLYLSVVTGVVNLLLNVVLVPWIGLYGAAIGTLVSYVVFIIVACRLSRRELSFAVPVKDMLLSLCAGTFMAFTVVLTSPFVKFDNLLIFKITIGCFAYAGFIAVFARSKIKILSSSFKPASV